MKTEKFLCPECGCQQPEPPRPGETYKQGTGMRREYLCSCCHFEIPAHLAERWGGISVEDARREWREVYRVSDRVKETLATL